MGVVCTSSMIFRSIFADDHTGVVGDRGSNPSGLRLVVVGEHRDIV
jgi:hypothetical protein